MRTIFLLPAIFIFLIFIQPSTAQTSGSVNQYNFLKNSVVAHRGAWKKDGLPQNSIASLKKAISLQVAGSEFDVQLTADGVLVLNHDPVYEGMHIEKTKYSGLKKYRLKNGEVLPTLYKYLKIGMRQQKTRLILELKPSQISKERSLLLAQKAVAKVNKMRAQPWITYISFDYDILKEIVRIDPSAETMFLGGNVSPVQLNADGISGADYHFNVFKNDANLILIFYFICILSLIGLFFLAPEIRGVKSWYKLGPVSLDPSEFIKLIMLVFLAKYFSSRHAELYKVYHIFLSGFYALSPAFLIAMQPNLGSAIVLASLWLFPE